jgi:hypothetical protein
MGEQFAVLIFFADGKRRYVCRFVSAQEACSAFEHCIHSVEARFGFPMRVVITDRYDCISREWNFWKGCPKIAHQRGALSHGGAFYGEARGAGEALGATGFGRARGTRNEPGRER